MLSDSKYIKHIVLNELNNSNFLQIRSDLEDCELLPDGSGPCERLPNINKIAIYAVRIYDSYNDNYAIKIGESRRDIIKRLYELNSYYKCKNRMNLLFFGYVNNINAEKDIHTKLKKYRIKQTFGNSITPKSREIYTISNNFYDDLSDLFQFHTDNNFFESQNYIIDENNNELIKIYDDERDYFDENNIFDDIDYDELLEDESSYIQLNHKFGEVYWNYHMEYINIHL